MHPVRLATPQDAAIVARLLHDFNTEFGSPTPGTAALTTRLSTLLEGDTTRAFIGGEPPIAIGLVTLRTNVWFDGPVGLLDEMYVAPNRRDQGVGTAIIEAIIERARQDNWGLIEINVDEYDHDTRRFYERHGFANTEPGSDERALYYWLEP